MKSEQTKTVRRLSTEEIWDFPGNSRIVALRWDLVPFGLVVDCDVPASEGANVPIHRGWLVFQNVSEISLPLSAARLPTGIWNHGGVAEFALDSRFKEYVLGILCPTFDLSDTMVGSPNKELRVTAMDLTAVLSCAGAQRGQIGLTYVSRIELADDAAMLSALELDATQ